jgi:hemerythrin-like domain-containing protein
MMTICQALLGEHAVFYKQFDYLEKQLGETKDVKSIVEATRPIAEALISHAEIENELLLSALEAVLGANSLPASVKQEHQDIDMGLTDALECTELEELKEKLSYVLSVVRSHFAMEEEALFVMCQETLSPEKLVALGEQWAQMRGVTLR